MLGQRDSCIGISAPHYEKELHERWKRNIWEDLIFAIQLLNKFDEELKKLHPDVTHHIRQLMN